MVVQRKKKAVNTIFVKLKEQHGLCRGELWCGSACFLLCCLLKTWRRCRCGLMTCLCLRIIFCISVERFTEIAAILQLMGAFRMNFCPKSSSVCTPRSHLGAGKDKTNDNRDQKLFFTSLFRQVNIVLRYALQQNEILPFKQTIFQAKQQQSKARQEFRDSSKHKNDGMLVVAPSVEVQVLTITQTFNPQVVLVSSSKAFSSSSP